MANPQLLNVVTNGSTTVNNTVTSTVCFSAIASQTTGRVDVKVKPNQDELVCDATPTVAKIKLTCPPSRTISHYVPSYSYSYKFISHTRFTYSSLITPSLQTPNCDGVMSTFTIPSDTLGIVTASGTVSYPCSSYGTPTPVYYGKPFRPKFALFDNGVYGGEVAADIAIYEVNGRNTFSFNTTAGQAGCRVKPQSWRDLISSSGNYPFAALNKTVKLIDVELCKMLQ